MERYILLEILRGIAVLGVLIFHRGMHSSLIGTPLEIIARAGDVSVQVFFILSGYTIYRAAERQFGHGTSGAVRFLWRRLRRIYPPFWVSLAIAYLISIFVAGRIYSRNEIVLSAFLFPRHFGADYPIVVYWMLVFEQQFYLVMTLLLLPIFDRVRTVLILLSAGIAILPYTGLLSNPLINTLLPRYWLEFLLGILIYRILAARPPRVLTQALFISLIAFAFVVTSASRVSALVALLIVLWHPLDARISALAVFMPLRWVALISYSLYLMHIPVFIVYDALFRVRAADLASSAHYWLSMLAALMVGIGFYWVVERHFTGAPRRTPPPTPERTRTPTVKESSLQIAAANRNSDTLR
ncbi:MAG: acyltransferase [Chloroflexota bacterium]|nr:acyltransferase [Chloroflexota bacterium]